MRLAEYRVQFLVLESFVKDEIEPDYRRKNIVGAIVYTAVMVGLLVLFVLIGMSEYGGGC